MKKLLIPVTIIAFLVSSCDVTSFDEDINKNPNLPSQASPSQLIANAMLSLPDLSSSPQGEYNAQYLSELAYVDGSLYQEGGTSFYGYYEGPLINLQSAIENSSVANEVAVARILKAYFFWHLTDRWGDIPYSDALGGANNFTPAYDTQEAIYDSLFTTLKEAADQIQAGGLNNDLMFEGDMDKWRKFSNTVRLLMALRLSEVNKDRAQQEFNDALEDGIMTSNEDSFVFRHLANENNENYWYNQVVRQSREWWALSEGLVQLMRPVDDPRLSVYGDPANSGDGFVGLTFGTTADTLLNTEDYSLLGADIHAQDAPVYLVTYAQALFAKAEAAELGWIAEDPVTSYNRAVENSILQWTGSTDGVEEFLAQPEVAYDPTNPIARIATQRYVHLFMHGYEAWAEYRRTGFPDVMVHPQGREVPLRQSYTPDEALNNSEHYQEAVDRQFGGENTLYGRLWWDREE